MRSRGKAGREKKSPQDANVGKIKTNKKNGNLIRNLYSTVRTIDCYRPSTRKMGRTLTIRVRAKHIRVNEIVSRAENSN